MPLTFIDSSSNVIAEQEKMLQSMRCVIGHGEAIYISGPITTGQIFLKWHLLSGSKLLSDPVNYKNSLISNVIAVNEVSILEIAEKVRGMKSNPVIEPASLRIDEWRQNDYIKFWLSVLEKFVAEIFFVDGWQYSAGCAAEFRFAIDSGYVVHSQNGQEITLAVGRDLVLKAADEIHALAEGDKVLIKLASSLRTEVGLENI